MLIGEAMIHRGICVVYGDPGLGKTTSVRDAVNRSWGLIDPETRWCELQFPLKPTALRLAKTLAEAVSPTPLNLRTEQQYTDYLERALVRPTVIFVDEAHLLTLRGMHQLRTLWDRPHTELTLIFAGLTDTFDRMSEDPAFVRRLHGDAPLARLTNRNVLDLMPSFHPLLCGVEPDVLIRINEEYARGSLGKWAAFMKWAEKFTEQPEKAVVDDEVVDQVQLISAAEAIPAGWEAYKDRKGSDG